MSPLSFIDIHSNTSSIISIRTCLLSRSIVVLMLNLFTPYLVVLEFLINFPFVPLEAIKLGKIDLF